MVELKIYLKILIQDFPVRLGNIIRLENIQAGIDIAQQKVDKPLIVLLQNCHKLVHQIPSQTFASAEDHDIKPRWHVGRAN